MIEFFFFFFYCLITPRRRAFNAKYNFKIIVVVEINSQFSFDVSIRTIAGSVFRVRKIRVGMSKLYWTDRLFFTAIYTRLPAAPSVPCRRYAIWWLLSFLFISLFRLHARLPFLRLHFYLGSLIDFFFLIITCSCGYFIIFVFCFLSFCFFTRCITGLRVLPTFQPSSLLKFSRHFSYFRKLQ